MENIVEDLGETLLSIQIEQAKINEKVNHVENKRHSILAYIKGLKLENENVMLDNMEKKFDNVEIKIKRKEGILNNQNVSTKSIDETRIKTRKCSFQNRGFYKFKEDCEYRHSEIICEEYLKDGKCKKKGCQEKHPKDCQYWLKCETGCSRGDTCMYLHCGEKKCKSRDDNTATEENIEYSCDKCNFKYEDKKKELYSSHKIKS